MNNNINNKNFKFKRSHTLNTDNILLEKEKKIYLKLKDENYILKNKMKVKTQNYEKYDNELKKLCQQYEKLKNECVIKVDTEVLENCFKYNNYDDLKAKQEEEMLDMVLKDSLKDNPEFNDNLTYEELIDLQDKVGHVSKGLKNHEKYLLNKIKNKNSKLTCPICIDKIEVNNYIYKLKCNHSFHTECVDKWFEDNKVCPICKQEVN